jgi:hypothetical protein
MCSLTILFVVFNAIDSNCSGVSETGVVTILGCLVVTAQCVLLSPNHTNTNSIFNACISVLSVVPSINLVFAALGVDFIFAFEDGSCTSNIAHLHLAIGEIKQSHCFCDKINSFLKS